MRIYNKEMKMFKRYKWLKRLVLLLLVLSFVTVSVSWKPIGFGLGGKDVGLLLHG